VAAAITAGGGRRLATPTSGACPCSALRQVRAPPRTLSQCTVIVFTDWPLQPVDAQLGLTPSFRILGESPGPGMITRAIAGPGPQQGKAAFFFFQKRGGST